MRKVNLFSKTARADIFLLLFFLLFLAAHSDIPFNSWKFFKAQIVQMSLTIHLAPSITTSGGEVITPTKSDIHQFEAGSGGTFDFVNPDGSSVKIVFFIGTTQVTLDFFIEAYEQGAIIADRPLPTGRNVVGSLIYDMKTFEGAISTVTFDAPFAMTVGYPQEQLGDLDEATMGIYFWDESQSIWIAFDIESRDTQQNTITILSDHLTFFATLGEAKQGALAAGRGVAPVPFNPAIPVSEMPVTEPERKMGDINNDGKVDILDFNILMVRWGETGPSHIADLNNDKLVSIFDFNLLMVHWSR